MTLETVDLHDALIKDMNIDHAKRTVIIDMHFYKNATDKIRLPASIVFEDVKSLSQTIDLVRLEENAFAGNISYWAPAQQVGTSFIYLTDGCIAINAGKVTFQERDSAGSM